MVRFAVICASNQNRSMEAHDVLKKKGFDVCSYGTGSQVKLPGTAPDRPNVYSFGKPYRQIYEDLAQKDENFYRQSGLLGMLERNWRIKEAPERFKDARGPFDVIICCEERCYEAVCEELSTREQNEGRPVHVINIDIIDNPQEAAIGARHISQLSTMIRDSEDLDSEIDQILRDFEEKTERQVLHTVLYC